MGPRLFCAEIPGGCDLRGSIHPHMRGDNCNRHSGPRAASMGPLFSAWKSGGENETDQHDNPLQWGHVFSDVEIRDLDDSLGGRGIASMGPRLFRRGNGDPVKHQVPGLRVASMGPRLFRRGNSPLVPPKGIDRTRFNGATSFQTWKWIVIDSSP